MSTNPALHQSLASCGAMLIAFIGACHEMVGSTLFPWGPALFGGPLGWHALGWFVIVGGLLALAGTLRLIRWFPVLPFAWMAAWVAGGLVVYTALAHHAFHFFALAASLAGLVTAYCHPRSRFGQ